MRVQINNKMLSDSPYSESNKDLFIPLHEDTDNVCLQAKLYLCLDSVSC